jgi:glyoxylase-like metal-dependent hydrolase (beta-lactamase superfamily II)
MHDLRTLRVGEAHVTVLNAGNMQTRLAEELAVPEALWRPRYAELFEHPNLFPSLSVYVALGGVRVLVDANDYRATMTPDSSYAVAGYTPPPAIPTQLAHCGVPPEAITHVVITHAHWDHFAGTTSLTDSGYVPTFPTARYYLGAADWRDGDLQAALQEPTSLEARTLGELHERGMLELVEQPIQLAAGLDILPAPGETPGHQLVRVRSGGEALYVVGDLFHDRIEVEHPDWMVGWADPETMRATRSWLLQEALAEHALLIAAHIATPGRVERADHGWRWQNVEA